MSLAQRWRSHRQRVRNDVAITRAIREASTPALRDELIAVAASQSRNYNY